MFQTAVFVQDVHVAHIPSFYTRWGDLSPLRSRHPGLTCLLVFCKPRADAV